MNFSKEELVDMVFMLGTSSVLKKPGFLKIGKEPRKKRFFSDKTRFSFFFFARSVERNRNIKIKFLFFS